MSSLRAILRSTHGQLQWTPGDDPRAVRQTDPRNRLEEARLACKAKPTSEVPAECLGCALSVCKPSDCKSGFHARAHDKLAAPVKLVGLTTTLRPLRMQALAPQLWSPITTIPGSTDGAFQAQEGPNLIKCVQLGLYRSGIGPVDFLRVDYETRATVHPRNSLWQGLVRALAKGSSA